MRSILIALIVLMSACTSGTTPEMQVISSIPEERFAVVVSEHYVEVDHVAATISLPFDRYLLVHSPSYMSLIDIAFDDRVESCMDLAGIEFEFPPRSQRVDWTLHTRRYGAFDLNIVAEHGYQWPHSAEVEALIASQQNLVPIVDEGLNGNGTSPGCMTSAADAVGASTVFGNHGFSRAQGLAARTLRISLGDRRVLDAIESWRECMGPHMSREVPATPMDLMGSYGTVDGKPIEGEVQTAIADVTCKRGTGLLETWIVVEAELQLSIIASNRPMLDDLRNASMALIEQSADIIGVTVPASPQLTAPGENP